MPLYGGVELFKSIDILIGVSGVMLLLSLLVTALTQMTVEAWGLRASHLEQGVAELLQHLGWTEGSAKRAEVLARLVLQGAASITREELVESLLDVTATHGEHHEAVTPLRGADPRLLVEDARHSAAKIAAEHPDLPASVSKSIALTQGPGAEVASDVFGLFDQVMSRVSLNFTKNSRLLVCGFALVVAVGLPLDTFDLLRRFSTSPEARVAAVKLAEEMSAAPSSDELKTQAVDPAIIVLPQSLGQWRQRWAQVNLAGVLASVLLLSLGAPFWFGLLKDLLRLRSSAAGMEEQDRLLRANRQAASQVPVGGEKGDLNALGRMR